MMKNNFLESFIGLSLFCFLLKLFPYGKKKPFIIHTRVVPYSGSMIYVNLV